MKKIIIRPSLLKPSYVSLNNQIWYFSYEDKTIQIPAQTKRIFCRLLKIADRDLRQFQDELKTVFISALLSFPEYMDFTVAGSGNTLVLLACNKISKKLVLKEEMKDLRTKNKVSLFTQDNPVMVMIIMLIISMCLWFGFGN